MASSFFFVGRRSEFRDGHGRVVTVDGTKVAVFRVGERFFALKDACPHMGYSLGDGKVEGLGVICHGHDWKFDLETGLGQGRRSCAVTCDVRLEDDDVLVRPPAKPASAENEDADELEDWVFWDADRYFKKKKDS